MTIDRDKMREEIKSLIIRQNNRFDNKFMLDDYERGILDTLVRVYDEEFCYGENSISIYDRIHVELDIDLMKQRKQRVEAIRKKIDSKIHETILLYPDLGDIILKIQEEAHKAIKKIDITKKRPELWEDMQTLKTKLNSMISLLTNRIMETE